MQKLKIMRSKLNKIQEQSFFEALAWTNPQSKLQANIYGPTYLMMMMAQYFCKVGLQVQTIIKEEDMGHKVQNSCPGRSCCCCCFKPWSLNLLWSENQKEQVVLLLLRPPQNQTTLKSSHWNWLKTPAIDERSGTQQQKTTPDFLSPSLFWMLISTTDIRRSSEVWWRFPDIILKPQSPRVHNLKENLDHGCQ